MSRAEVDGTTLHDPFDGAHGAPAVMLSNALASNLAMSDHQVPALLEAGYLVLRDDSRSHGRSKCRRGRRRRNPGHHPHGHRQLPNAGLRRHALR